MTITLTNTPLPTETSTPEPTATRTPTFGQMMKDNIVFYLIYPEKGRTDACGDIRVDPIISKRLRSGDKVYDVQVALNMLLGINTKIYGVWYNALWDSDMTINSVQYKAEKDYILIDFGGRLPAGHFAPCDGPGIRQEIWTTIQHYGFKEKTLTVNGHFLIDELGR